MFKFSRLAPLLVICCILVSVGCSTTAEDLSPQPTRLPAVTDTGLLYGEPCDPPCWEDITPGISTGDNVVHTLERLKAEGRIDFYSVTNGRHYLAGFSSGGSVNIILENEYVTELTVGYLGQFDYRVGQVVERFGEPEAYAPKSRCPENECSCLAWDESTAYEQPSVPGYLLYPLQGVTVVIDVAGNYVGCVYAEMRTAVFWYYEPRSLEDAFKEDRSPAFGRLRFRRKDIIEWHGYGPGY